MNKFLTVFIFSLALLVLSCSSKKPGDCARFREGKFLLKSSKSNDRFIITRDSAVQTELNERTDTLTGQKIIWVSDCEYELLAYYMMPHYSDTTNKDLRAEVIMDITPLKVKIIETGRDYYVFESWKEGVDFIYKDTLWVIK